jgi:hypothetical protein
MFGGSADFSSNRTTVAKDIPCLHDFRTRLIFCFPLQ